MRHNGASNRNKSESVSSVYAFRATERIIFNISSASDSFHSDKKKEHVLMKKEISNARLCKCRVSCIIIHRFLFSIGSLYEQKISIVMISINKNRFYLSIVSYRVLAVLHDPLRTSALKYQRDSRSRCIVTPINVRSIQG